MTDGEQRKHRNCALAVSSSSVLGPPANWVLQSCANPESLPAGPAFHPIHSGCCAVPSKCDVVLNGSNLPVMAACLVLSSSVAISASLMGLKVRAASNAWSSRSIVSQPLITTDVGKSERVVQAFDRRHRAAFQHVAVPQGFIPSTAMPCFTSFGTTWCESCGSAHPSR